MGIIYTIQHLPNRKLAPAKKRTTPPYATTSPVQIPTPKIPQPECSTISFVILPPNPNTCHDLFRQWDLLIITFLAITALVVNNVKVDARAFAREDFRVHTVLTKVDLCAINGVHENSWESAENLEREIGRFDNVD